ncbi:MAG: PIN domain nuclease [Candidatus Atribacteria bacterium]|nr:PIN domain nuclease [Candidatus Atribacteria bacterium]
MNREEKLFLIDTSAWILGLKRNSSNQIKNILTEILDKDQSATTGIIILELLQGSKTKKEYTEILSDLSALHYFEVKKEIWEKASQLGFDLRRKGKTIPSTDLLIASIALHYNLILLHADNHFKQIQEHTSLKTKNLYKIL